MKARIKITLKNGVLDPQGKAIQNALGSLGIAGVNRVLDAPDEYRHLGAAGLAMIRERFTLDVCLPKMLDLYERAQTNYRGRPKKT